MELSMPSADAGYFRRPVIQIVIGLALALLMLMASPLLRAVQPARAATPIYVRTDGSDAACNGTVNAPASAAPNCAKSTISAAIAAVDSGGTVRVEVGTFNEDLVIIKNMTLRGVGSALTTIAGSGTARVIRIDAGYTVTIQHVTISGGNQTGYASGGGGGIRNSGDLTLSNCVVTNNYGEPKGGGIANESGASLAINRCTISGNTTYHAGETGLGGGGIYNQGTLTMTDSTIIDNQADDSPSDDNYGGGIFNHDGTMTLERVTVTNNTATGYGGGIMIGQSLGGSSTLKNVTITGNTTKSGGGIGVTGGAGAGPTTINNTTIAGNTATYTASGGGGLHAYAPVVVRNSIIDDNSMQECGGDPATYISSGGYNLAEDSTCGFASTGDQQNTDAKLGLLRDNGGRTETMALGKGSPAIDAGNPTTPGSGGSACEYVDQREWFRPIDGDLNGTPHCDIGAYEATINLFLPLIMR